MRPRAAVALQSWRPMSAKRSPRESINGVGLAARLHDATTRLALGMALLPPLPIEAAPYPDQIRPIHLLEDSLASLKRIGSEIADRETQSKFHGLAEDFERQARQLGIDLDLRIIGSAESICPALGELLRLSGREALVNVRRHAASRKCQITLDLTVCPFEFSARDWGAGFSPTTRDGQGIRLLRGLAEWLGCRVVMTSQPGLGSELSVFGPTCPNPAGARPADLADEVRTRKSHVRRSDVARQSHGAANSGDREQIREAERITDSDWEEMR